MKKRLFASFAAILFCASLGIASDGYFKYGPLELTVPFKTADVVYLYDGINKMNLVGGETTVVKLWDRISGTVGVVTSLDGQGSPFLGADLELGNVLDKILDIGAIRLGGFGGRNFREGNWVGGLKASVKLW